MTTERDDAMNLNPSTMLRAFCDAVEQRNGKAFSELFAEDGVYHDVFYGAFEGRAKIAGLIDDWFYRTATDFRWDMHDPVSDGNTLYARYTFSYRSTLPEAEGARGVPRGRQHRAGLRRHQVCAGAHRQDRCETGRGAEGAAGDEAAFGGVTASPRHCERRRTIQYAVTFRFYR
jgi:ketosteroid isomerase-like protein